MIKFSAALYRKYRPQKLLDLDSQRVRSRLVKILSSPYLPQALLFAGPKGTGKTSAARIVAKVLNCEKRKKNSLSFSESLKNEELARETLEPCNSCEICLAITSGKNLDVLEIDAASNRGIEEIRELREKIKLAPFSSPYKVYIIDEVHMLTTEAFNALLKTLEEPPFHAVFILATTAPERLPPTILSRCLRINFQKATTEEILHSLKRVAAGEKLVLKEDFLRQIADFADGSFRDATKILEQSIAEGITTAENLSRFLGRSGLGAENFLRLMLGGETEKTLAAVQKLSEEGADFRFLVGEILHLLHLFLLAKYKISKEEFSLDLEKKLEKENLIFLIQLFSRVYQEIPKAIFPELPLAVAVVEWEKKKNHL